jgi:hypothetical protein
MFQNTRTDSSCEPSPEDSKILGPIEGDELQTYGTSVEMRGWAN